MRHLPDEGLRGQRQRLQTTVKRLGDRYMWQEIEETGIPRAAAELDARIAERPAPADSNLLASDRAASTLLPFAEIVRETTSDHRQRHPTHRGARRDRRRRRSRDCGPPRGAAVLRRLSGRCCKSAPGRTQGAICRAHGICVTTATPIDLAALARFRRRYAQASVHGLRVGNQ